MSKRYDLMIAADPSYGLTYMVTEETAEVDAKEVDRICGFYPQLPETIKSLREKWDSIENISVYGPRDYIDRVVDAATLATGMDVKACYSGE